MMDKFKHQALVIGICILIGGISSGIFVSINKNKEIEKLNEEHKKQLEKEIEKSLEIIDERNYVIIELARMAKEDSLKIMDLQKQIEQDGVRVEEKINKAKNFTDEEKRNFLIDRYSNKP